VPRMLQIEDRTILQGENGSVEFDCFYYQDICSMHGLYMK